jgi:hypothetical protein
VLKKSKENNIAEDKKHDAPVMMNGFWDDFMHLKVTTVCKHATVRDDYPSTFVELAYMHQLMQKLMNSQLDDKDKTTTPREIKARVKAEFKRH